MEDGGGEKDRGVGVTEDLVKQAAGSAKSTQLQHLLKPLSSKVRLIQRLE